MRKMDTWPLNPSKWGQSPQNIGLPHGWLAFFWNSVLQTSNKTGYQLQKMTSPLLTGLAGLPLQFPLKGKWLGRALPVVPIELIAAFGGSRRPGPCDVSPPHLSPPGPVVPDLSPFFSVGRVPLLQQTKLQKVGAP